MPSLSAAKFTTRRCRSTGLAKRLNVFGRNVRAAVQQRPGFAAENQELHGPRSGAPGNLIVDEVGHARFAHAGLPHQRQRVANHVVGDGTSRTRRCKSRISSAVSTGTTWSVMSRRGAAGDFEFLAEVRILDEHLEHEPILLRFGQRIRPFLLDRVLRGQHEERIGQADAARGRR